LNVEHGNAHSQWFLPTRT